MALEKSEWYIPLVGENGTEYKFYLYVMPGKNTDQWTQSNIPFLYEGTKIETAIVEYLEDLGIHSGPELWAYNEKHYVTLTVPSELGYELRIVALNDLSTTIRFGTYQITTGTVQNTPVFGRSGSSNVSWFNISLPLSATQKFHGFGVNTNEDPTYQNMFMAYNFNYDAIAAYSYPGSISASGLYYYNKLLADKPSTDKGQPPGPNEPAGGDGDFDNSSDIIPIPEFPTVKNPGMAGIYNPTYAELNELTEWLWTPSVIEGVLKWNSNPIENILSLHAIPVPPQTSGKGSIKIGNLLSPDFQMNYVSSQYQKVEFGTIGVPEYWGSFLDYSPYTQIQIYLPFIGTNELNVDDVMKSQLTLTYNIDVLTGMCVATIHVLNPDRNINSVLYTFTGNCSMPTPVLASQQTAMSRIATEVIKSSIGIAVGAAAGAAAGALTAAPAEGMTDAILNKGVTSAASVAQEAAGRLSQTNPNKPREGIHSGSTAYNAGWMSPLIPHLLINRPIQAQAGGYQTFHGYPCNMNRTLGSLTGYTKVSQVHLENISGATLSEVNEIERLLKDGVIL